MSALLDIGEFAGWGLAKERQTLGLEELGRPVSASDK
jgi:hypothetical protein